MHQRPTDWLNQNIVNTKAFNNEIENCLMMPTSLFGHTVINIDGKCETYQQKLIEQFKMN